MSSQFIDLFHRSGDRDRSKFLARVFGIFSEEIVRLWAALPASPYEDLGRPTIRFDGQLRWSTLDFTLKHRESNRIYVAEMKCEIEYENFRYFVLESPQQLEHHTKEAFRAFLRIAREPHLAKTTVGGRSVTVDGAILVWGAGTSAGCGAVKEHYRFADVLTVEAMINRLATAKDADYVKLLRVRREWLDEMFSSLAEISDNE